MSREIRKLLFVSDAPLFGGAERYVANLVAAATRRGMTSIVCWVRPETAPGDVFADARAHGAQVRTLPADRSGRLLPLCLELRSLLRAERPDAMIVNACGRPRFWVVPWVARLERIPSVWVHQMVDQNDYRRLAPRWFGGRIGGLHLWRWPQAARHRLAATASSAVISLNEQDRIQIAREHNIRPRRIHVVSHGVDTECYRFNPQSRRQVRGAWNQASLRPLEDAFVVGTAGRLVHGKGIEMLLQAVATLVSRGLPVQAVIAGEGPDRDRLDAIAEKLSIADRVLFLGGVSDMPAFYSGLDAFALCSSTESFGLVLAEAMACERAVVATPTAGARTQIDTGSTGLVLNSFSAGELADCFEQLCRQPELREQFGCCARRSVIQNFSSEATLKRTLQAMVRPRGTKDARRMLAFWDNSGWGNSGMEEAV